VLGDLLGRGDADELGALSVEVDHRRLLTEQVARRSKGLRTRIPRGGVRVHSAVLLTRPGQTSSVEPYVLVLGLISGSVLVGARRGVLGGQLLVLRLIARKEITK
jgi:hypothetical protein